MTLTAPALTASTPTDTTLMAPAPQAPAPLNTTAPRTLHRTLHRTLRLAVTLVVVATTAVTTAGCRGGCGGDDASELIVYSGRSEALVGPIFAEFERETGTRLRVHYADSVQLAATLLEEGSRSRADVYFAQDASTLGYLAAQGLLAELPAPVRDRVHAGWRDADGRWVGTTGRARVVVYNPERVSDDALPRSLADLTDPRWAGRVGWAPDNASFQSFVAAMIQQQGREDTLAWLTAMQANRPRAFPSNVPLVTAVDRGEIDLALSNHYYAHRLRDEHGPAFRPRNHYLRDGSAGAMINASGVAVLASSRRPELAQQLVAWLLSPAVQARFVDANHEFPLAIDATPPGDSLPAVDSLNAPVVDFGQLDDLDAAIQLLRDAGVLM